MSSPKVTRLSLLVMLSCVVMMAILSSACHQKMANEPKYIPLRESEFFDDGNSSRPLVQGTIARGYLQEDREFFTGKASAQVSGAVQPLAGGQDVTAFPLPITRQVLDRGEERFNIFCAPCHGRLGDGEGMIVKRGYRHPPSYHIDRLRQAPVGHFFDVITSGFGVMPDYAQQIAPVDRWSIVAYIRALQLSQSANVADVPESVPNSIGGIKKGEGEK
jgi:hypothetical protein